MFSKLVAPAFALAALANGAMHSVLVGDGGLKFTPNMTTAAVGDTVQFSFVRYPHNVIHGDFANACHPANASAFYSGTVMTANQTFTITVNSTDPLYFYCSYGRHCQLGMVGAINPASNMPLAAFAQAASSVSNSSSPAQVQGGSVGTGTASVTSSPSGTATAMTSSMGMGTSTSAASSSSSPPPKGAAGRLANAGSLVLGLPMVALALA